MLAVFAGLVAAVPAQATFHHIKVRTVYPGPGNGTGFVELQMYEEGESRLEGHSLTVYGSAGELIHSSTFTSGVPNAVNQSTILIGEGNVATMLGVAPDLVDTDLDLPTAGAAVCWNSDGAPSDCVAWGDFHGANQLSNGTGTPILPGGFGATQAIVRNISAGCSTLLEESDDTDNSAADFTVLNAAPVPRNNAVAPGEHPCQGMVPSTLIDEHPASRTTSRIADFTFGAPAATRFQCRLDAGSFQACGNGERSSAHLTNLTDGAHTFRVFGENAAGADPTPAEFTWTVDTIAPTMTIDTHPTDPSPGTAAAFTFHASEATSKFECSLLRPSGSDPFSACTSPKTYAALPDGAYTFQVRATDLAGNPQATPTTFTWHVDNQVADVTPPDTSITTKPPDPSTSATATFGYASTEANSTFECSMDGASFNACPATGITFQGLGSGPHTFRVRATDPSHNTDQSPAAYTFTVAVSATSPPPPPPPPAQPSAPNTRLLGRAPKSTTDTTPTFRFSSDAAGASFRCAVDKGRFKACHSPFTTGKLKPGRHSILVRATANGLTDASALKISFAVVRKRAR